MRLFGFKKLFITILFSFIFILFLITSPHIYAGEGIITEVYKYKYENDDIYYSDAYFAHSATNYDSHLATLSILMSKFSMNPGSPDTYNDTKWYNAQSNRVKGFFEKIGFDSFIANDDYKSQPDFDTIGVGAAKKTVGDYTVIGVAVRSGGYFREWSNNVYLGDGSQSDYMHEGWYNAANKLISHVRKYIDLNGINGKIKLWMSGFSRGGAVTNLAAGLIDNHLNDSTYISNKVTLTHDDLYAYTFEAPQGANVESKTVKYPHDELYNNIYNVVNPNDLVTKVAMKNYGFTRFGIDKIITTKFYDSDNFTKNREVFKKIYSEANNDVSKYNADTFEMKGITGGKIAGILGMTIATGPIGGGITGLVIEKVSGLVTPDNTKANYDANVVVSLVLDELVNSIGNRSNYARGYQPLLKSVLYVLTSDTKVDKNVAIVNFIYNLLLESMLNRFGISGSIISKVYKNYETEVALKNVVGLASVLVSAYVERPNEMISLITNLSSIFQNHDTDVNVAHLKCQDEYYINAYNENHPDDKINLVPLRDNADLVRIAFYGYNSVQVEDEAKKTVVDVDGHVFGKSDVRKCESKYAVGYYSYITEEKMELYLPVNNKYKVSFKSYSKKLRHLVKYNTFIQYITAQNITATNNGSKTLPSGSDHAWFNSDRKSIDINVKP